MLRPRSPISSTCSIDASLGLLLAMASALALAVGAARVAPVAPDAGLLAVDAIPGAMPTIGPELLDAARSLGAASAALESGDFEAAETSLARARAAAPLASYVDLFEARLLLARGRHEDATRAARRGSTAHAKSPVGPAFTQLLGDALVTAGNETAAREAWQNALGQAESRERDEELRIAILSSHARTGTLHDAIARDLAPAVPVSGKAIMPPSLEASLRPPAASLRRADQLLRAGHSADAITAYDAALAGGAGELTASSRLHAELQRGHARFRLRRYREAIQSFAALLPESEARFWHARSLARTGNPKAAIRSFEAIAAAGDRRYASWSLYLAGTLLEDAGELERAMALYRRVAAADRGSERSRDALWRLGWALYRQNDFAAAREVLDELATRAQGLDELQPRYWSARAAEQAGNTDDARAELTLLATRHPISYYGWRASQQLGFETNSAGTPDLGAPVRIPRGRSQIAEAQKLRVALLLEAQLEEFAQAELGSIVGRARSLEDRTSLGRLYALTGDFHRAQRLVVDAYSEILSRGLQRGNEALWWLSWPPAYREILMQVFPANAAIDPALVWAIMREESGYRPWITSSAGARGLLQIMPETAQRVASRNGFYDFQPDDLYVPEVNIALGSAYLDELSRRFPNRISATIGSYNAGPRAVSGWLRGDRAKLDDDTWVEEIPYKQTRTYVKRVLRSLLVYRTFYAAHAPKAPGA